MKKTAIFISSEFLGSGDNELGAKLMGKFLATLGEVESLWKIMIVNAGVKLCAVDGEALEALLALEKSGIEIVCCNTCLDFFGVRDGQRVGKPTNMMDITTSLELADKIINI